MEEMKSGYMDQRRINSITERIICAGIEVHRALGPGLLESMYEDCLTMELNARGLKIERQKPILVVYMGMIAGLPLRLDLVVENEVIVELKAVEKIIPLHQAQLLTYLKLSGCPIGLIPNFNSPLLKDGICRIINTPNHPS